MVSRTLLLLCFASSMALAVEPLAPLKLDGLSTSANSAGKLALDQLLKSGTLHLDQKMVSSDRCAEPLTIIRVPDSKGFAMKRLKPESMGDQIGVKDVMPVCSHK